MRLDEAIEIIKVLLLKTEPPRDTQLGWLETWVHKEDVQGLRMAIEAMRKYRKIEGIIKSWKNGTIEEKDSIYAFHEIMKVIEDGNAD